MHFYPSYRYIDADNTLFTPYSLDIDDIRMVINFDFPNDIENYVHRYV